ncbi:hypothetical protein Lal_00017020 [Lupinus albus]|nr:hypothetical protein Lal_00017020 [Lupinus albus]
MEEDLPTSGIRAPRIPISPSSVSYSPSSIGYTRAQLSIYLHHNWLFDWKAPNLCHPYVRLVFARNRLMHILAPPLACLLAPPLACPLINKIHRLDLSPRRLSTKDPSWIYRPLVTSMLR